MQDVAGAGGSRIRAEEASQKDMQQQLNFQRRRCRRPTREK